MTATTSARKKILFVYTPTGTTSRFWGNRSSGSLTDAHFGSITKAAGLNSLKEHLIMFNGVSHYKTSKGETPRDHYEFYAPDATAAYEYARYGGMSHVLAGGGGYIKSDDPGQLGQRKLESIDQYFIKSQMDNLHKIRL